MKIAAINGSPRGRESVTNMMVTSFLKGAEQARAKTVNIFLAEKDLNHCKGCFSCWFATPGKCVIENDDMMDIVSQTEGTDILILATPLKYANVSSMLKVFIERMLIFSNPYIVLDQNGETRHPKKAADAESSFYRAKLVAIANGGLGQRGHFQVLSHWIKRFALNNLTEVIGEIYASQGPLLGNPAEELQPIIDNYQALLEKAGQEIATDYSLSEETERRLEQDLVPEEIYLQRLNGFFDDLLSKVQHPYAKGWDVDSEL
jgi:multimeric flavodoxin WrbA